MSEKTFRPMLTYSDEAHRSIFNRYGSIFKYFDSFLVGLTATPKDEVDANTYHIFGCEAGTPNYDYSLDDAIHDKYLVGYNVISRTSEMISNGIDLKKLSDDELEQLEEYLDEDPPTPDFNIPGNEMFKYLFNKDTCRHVLEDLMQHGLRVDGGETMGKTIIFAYNHRHADMIVKCFTDMYQEYPPNTCQLVDYSVSYLIKNGEIDVEQIKRIGTKGISAGAEGFIRGSVSATIMIMCESGMLGEGYKGINPNILGTVVALVMQTVKNSILVAVGKMSSHQMGAAFVDSIVISGGYLAGAHIGGIIGQALGFELPVFGYLLGSLIGISFSAVYNIGKKKLISFCVDTGFTCFGLVDQNYELPEEVLNELGIETIPIPRTEVETVDIPCTNIDETTVDTTEYETIDITVLRRGVIGVNKVGYIFN